MALTQKYKQQQQQVRVLTNESNYLKGMYFSDIPLAEGYSRVLVNYDIDSYSGKISPRKGLQSLGVIRPTGKAKQYLNNYNGFNVVVDSKVCAESDTTDPRQINKHLQTIVYNTETRTLLTTTCAPEITEGNQFKAASFSYDHTDEYVTPEPFVIANPGVHGKNCIHNQFFKHPVGTFAFGNSYYTFLSHSIYRAKKLADLPNENYVDAEGNLITNYEQLASVFDRLNMLPGQYFVFTDPRAIAYCTELKKLATWEYSEEELLNTTFKDTTGASRLCYTRLGVDIKNDPEIELLDKSLIRSRLEDNQYYVCVITPKQLNPTEASSWGYNMLLKNPYEFACEDTAVNLVTILGVLPYDKDGKVTLTPRKNQEITLKGYYRAPRTYHSDAQNARYYATTKRKFNATERQTIIREHPNGTYRLASDTNVVVIYGYVIGQSDTQCYYYKDGNNDTQIVSASDLETEEIESTIARDPLAAELAQIATDVTNNPDAYNFGDWWYCSDDARYYMVMPNNSLTSKKLDLWGDTQPAASVKLDALPEGTENTIRVRWEMRSAGAATWTTLNNEEPFTLSDYYAKNGDLAPFTIPVTMPDSEVLIKLTITDPNDLVDGEEAILSTNTIGLSLVSDTLANTLNLDAKSFDLGQCTGMCEWEQRLVLWGVPGALNTLFVSDVNNPAFFPYPNNIDIFQDPIVAVHNYGDELLVLTTSALYRLIWDAEGTGWTHKLVQQNLHIAAEDTYMSCVIKNMFFFKSGEYFYMMVPKTTSAASVRGEVAIAPISKPIENLLDNFHVEVYNLIKVMVDQPSLADFTDKLVNYFSYVDNTKVVVNYVYALDNTTADSTAQDIASSKYLYVQLIYDTEIRTWVMRAFEAAHMLYASHADAIQQDRFIDLTPVDNEEHLALQYYKFTDISDNTVQYLNSDGEPQNAVRVIKNYQYLDTGNREINTELKKRFREFQFKIKNLTATNLGFFTSFLIDGSLRKDLQHYNPRLILDPATNEATVVVERTLDAKTMTYNTTRVERILIPERMLQDQGELTPTILAEETDPDRWVLDQSAFPGRTLCKIRMPISGKGLSPRAILLSTNELEYEILGHAWVYRTMHGR